MIKIALHGSTLLHKDCLYLQKRGQIHRYISFAFSKHFTKMGSDYMHQSAAWLFHERIPFFVEILISVFVDLLHSS